MLFHPKIFSREEVERAVTAAKEAILEGKSVISFSSLGTSATMQQTVSPQKVLSEALLYFQTVAPEEFGHRPSKTGRIVH